MNMDEVMASIHCAISKTNMEQFQKVLSTTLQNQPSIGLKNNVVGFSTLKCTSVPISSPSSVLSNQGLQLSLPSPGIFVLSPNALAISSVSLPKLPLPASNLTTNVCIPSDKCAVLPPALSSATKSLANILAEMHKQQRSSGRRYNGQGGRQQNTGNIPSLLNLNLNAKTSMSQTTLKNQSNHYMMNQSSLLSSPSSNLGGSLGLGGNYGRNTGGGDFGGSSFSNSLGGGNIGRSSDSMYSSGNMWQSDIRSHQFMGSSLLGNPPIMSGGNYTRGRDITEDDFAAKVRLQQAMLAQESGSGGRRTQIELNDRHQQRRRGSRKRTSDEIYDPTRPTDDFDDSEPNWKRGARDNQNISATGPWRCNVCNVVSSNLQDYKFHMDSQSHRNAINQIKMVANFQTDQAKARIQAQQHLRMIEGKGKGGTIGSKNRAVRKFSSETGDRSNTAARGDRHFCRECQIFFTGSTINHRETSSHQDAKRRVQQSQRYCKICNTTFKDNEKCQAHCNSERHKKECAERKQNRGSAKSEDYVTVDAIGIFEEEVDEGCETSEDTTKQQELGKDKPNGTKINPSPAEEVSQNEVKCPTETPEKPSEETSNDAPTDIDTDIPSEVSHTVVSKIEKIVDQDEPLDPESVDSVNECSQDSLKSPEPEPSVEPEPLPSKAPVPSDEPKPLTSEATKPEAPSELNNSSEINSSTASKIPKSMFPASTALCKQETVSTTESVTTPVSAPKPHQIKRLKQTRESINESPICSEPEDEELSEYDPNTPVGQCFVVPVSGYFCKLCHKFYLKKAVAKVTHCSSQPHFNALKVFLNV
ncbi:uncharacterized protein [Antedon mediterranea]|uniref:uncharacterized protein isoform X2 n=1 Tax=Antedon mediterranea TaxID=105859 RepID=UPI003AF56B76